MDDLVATGDLSPERRDVLSVLWAITKACTFRCSYCDYYRSPKEAEFSRKEDLLRAARTLLRLGRPSYQITLYGGEPTLHPHFKDLLSYLSTTTVPIELRMFTNGGQSASFFEGILGLIGRFDFRIIFSLHLEYANVAKFVRAVEVCAAGGLSVGVSLMFSPSRRVEARKAFDDLMTLRQRVPFFMGIAYPYTKSGDKGVGCTPEDTAWVDESRRIIARLQMPAGLRTPYYTRTVAGISFRRASAAEELSAAESIKLLASMHTPSWENFYCCSGTNVYFVEEDGSAHGGVCTQSARIGNLFRDSEIQLIQNARVVQCQAPGCNSIENIPLPKFLDCREAEQNVVGFQNRARQNLFLAEATRLNLTAVTGGTQALDAPPAAIA